MNLIFKLKRKVKYFFQRLSRGWDDADTWSLSSTIAGFALPRLIRFKQLNNGYPYNLTMKKWESILDDMIYALTVCNREKDGILDIDEVDWNRVSKGCTYFGLYLRELWW